MAPSSTEPSQVTVVGVGPTGLAAALVLGHLGIRVSLAGPPRLSSVAVDQRTTALLQPSIQLLKNLGAWAECAKAAVPLHAIRIVDDRGGLLRAPEVLMTARELELESFGANIPNAALIAALDAAIDRAKSIQRVATSAVIAVDPCEAFVRLRLAEGEAISTQLAIAADGRHSLVRAAAGIRVLTWTYPQAAIVTSFQHSKYHAGTATELHRRSGPLTTVPLPGRASALVWVEEPEAARRIAALDDCSFVRELQESLQGMLGSIHTPQPRVQYQLMGMRADTLARSRVALVGEAGHVMPPIGAQGLNLGLRDAAALGECIADACASGQDPGEHRTLEAYQRARAGDVLTRSLSVEALNLSLLADMLPVQALRGIGLHLIANVPPLRRFLMRSGLGPAAADLPRLMQPNVG